MKTKLLDWIICPSCLPAENGLSCSPESRDSREIITGTLHCAQCGAAYPIQDGLAFLLPRSASSAQAGPSKYEDPASLSAYLWGHYADMFHDQDASSAYTAWSGLLNPAPGPALDLGCAVGRFTFELSQKFDFAIGLDNSIQFVTAARRLMTQGWIDFSLIDEGRLDTPQNITLPSNWDPGRVEFIVADALALPFKSGLFSAASSLNLLDKVPFPLVHLQELNRISRSFGAQLLVSDPYSWSPLVAAEADWLGGVLTGPFTGKGRDNVKELLCGRRTDSLSPGWDMRDRGEVWWRLRNHANHFELIRSCYITTVR
ncbi:MAG: methyltransferase domain-containing protein [Deltaproteobacteria bacterium]|nr:methyltransferase domain-containing protein [Deltaproteobacteria bacterium]